MTLLSALGFQPSKRKDMAAPTSISCTDISIVPPVKNNQKSVTLFLSEFLKTHSPALYPREIIIVDNASQPPIIIPKALAERGLNITMLHCDAPGPACARAERSSGKGTNTPLKPSFYVRTIIPCNRKRPGVWTLN